MGRAAVVTLSVTEKATMEIEPLSPALGAEVREIDLSRALTEAQADGLRAAMWAHHVLLFRGQSLPPPAQIAVTALFGAVQPHPLRTRRSVPGFDAVLILENRPGRPGARNDYWHSDISHRPQPPSVSCLHSEIVPVGRGDTQFCNMHAAFQALSPELRRKLIGLEAIHSAKASVDRNNLERSDGLPIATVPPPHAHPVVRAHPATGRPALFVNPHFTIGLAGMTEAESRPLLEGLYSAATRDENVFRHRWAVGDVLMWDNRSVMHFAIRDYDETMPRRMYRTTAAGEAPIAWRGDPG
jgi:taurine dioxygenase